LSNFTLHTQINIIIYVPYPKGSNVRDLSGLPPELLKENKVTEKPERSGLLFKESGAPEVWTSEELPTPGPNEQIFVAHELIVSNRVGEKGVDPCLEAAPVISESLSSLVSGITETSAVSFTLLNPSLQRLFSNEFVTTRSLVVIRRVADEKKTVVWRGEINRVSFEAISTTIFARPEIKLLDNQATFGFDLKIRDWAPGYRIPIVSARLIPYSIEVADHPPTLANSYEGWLKDYTSSADFINNNLNEQAKESAGNLIEQISNHTPDYINFDPNDLIQTRSYPITSKEGTPNSPEWFWLRVERGIYIFPSEDEEPQLPSYPIGPADIHEQNFRESMIPINSDNPKRIVTKENFDYIPFQINTGFSYCHWGVLGKSDNELSDSLFLYPVESVFVDSNNQSGRPAHPLDSLYTRNNYQDKYTMYSFWTTHSLSRFYPVNLEVLPSGFYGDYWASFVRSFPLNQADTLLKTKDKGFVNLNEEAGVKALLSLPRTRARRSKDVFTANSQFKNFQSPNAGNDDDLFRFGDFRFIPYSFRNTILPSPSHKGSGILRTLPAINDDHQAIDGEDILKTPKIFYEQGKGAGGAYFVSAEYPVYLRRSYKDLRHALLRGKITGYGRRNPLGGVTGVVPLFNQVIVRDSESYNRIIRITEANEIIAKVKLFNLRMCDISTVPLATADQARALSSIQGIDRSVHNEFDTAQRTRWLPRGDGEEGIVTFHGIRPFSGNIANIPTRAYCFNTDFQSFVDGDHSFEEGFGSSWDRFWSGGSPFETVTLGSSVSDYYYYLWGDRLGNLNISAIEKFDGFYTERGGRAFPGAARTNLIERSFYRLRRFTSDQLGNYDLGGNNFDSGYNESYWVNFQNIVGGLAVTTTRIYVIDNEESRMRVYDKNNLSEIFSRKITEATFTSMFAIRVDDEDLIGGLDNDNKIVRFFREDGIESVGNFIALDPNFDYCGADVSKDGKYLYLLTNYVNGTQGEIPQGTPDTYPIWRFNIQRLDFDVSKVQLSVSEITTEIPDIPNPPPIELPWDVGTLPDSFPRFSPEINPDFIYNDSTDDKPPRELWNNLFSFYYHHDMVGANSDHLKPSTFLYAVLRAAGLTPAFEQDGSDIPGSLNNHLMQLIEDTNRSYRDLISRVLPALGYIVRINYTSGEVELIDIATRQWEKWNMGDDIIQLNSIDADFDRQYSSFIFENDDMTRGKNTLEEWKDDPNQQGRFTIFNANPFVNGRTLTIKTGTWTSEFTKVATLLSLRRDRVKWRVSNFHLLAVDGRLMVPRIGDIVKLNSKKIPNSNNIMDVLVVYVSQNDVYTEFEGISFG